MADAHFKDLCMDASDALVLARFWGRVLGVEVTDLGDGSARVEQAPGRPTTERIWVNPVPEPRTVKTRVHLDLRLSTADPAPLVAAGASVVRPPGVDRWWVLADPDGNEFCAFPPTGADIGGPPRVQPFELTVDCADAVAQATWWAARTGGRVCREDGKPWAWVEDAEGFPWDAWVFGLVPEPKTVKNRVHWDVDLTADDPGALVDAGARIQREPGGDIFWWVLADPEGNDFCAFAPKQA